MRRDTLVLGAAVLLFVSGCWYEPELFPCETDANCPTGMVCDRSMTHESTGLFACSDPGRSDDDVADDDDLVASCASAAPCSGDYVIQTSDMVTQIARCEDITGVLTFWYQGWLVDIDLPCLAFVGGDLTIRANDALEDISGLSGLATAGGNLYIRDNPVLTDLDLSGLTSVEGGLTIISNNALEDISGLSSLTTVSGDLSIVSNPLLCQSRVDAFIGAVTVGGSTYAYGNDDGC